MKTTYSILYVTLNATLNERISIGLLMTNGIEHYFKFSSEKLFAIKSMIDDERYNMVKAYLKSLEKEIGVGKNALQEPNQPKTNWINEGYLSYLSQYSNNIIQFASPKTIDIALDLSNFKKVFEKYIAKIVEDKNAREDLDVHAIVKSILFPKIALNVNLEKTITSNDFKHLFVPIAIDFIGKNGIPVAGQTIDFEKKSYYLENDVTRFVSLTKAIELQGNPKGKYYILGREPQQNKDKEHHLWTQIRASKFLEFVDIEEVGIVEEYITNNNVQPFFEQ